MQKAHTCTVTQKLVDRQAVLSYLALQGRSASSVIRLENASGSPDRPFVVFYERE